MGGSLPCLLILLSSFLCYGHSQVVLNLETDRSPIFSGESVEFKCDIKEGKEDNWYYRFFKDGREVRPYDADKEYEFKAQPGTSGEYHCEAEYKGAPHVQRQSKKVSLIVSALPTATVRFSPDHPVYTGETLAVTCTIQSVYTDWTYTWFRGETSTKVKTSVRHGIVGNILTISKVEESDQDDYWCLGERQYRPKTSTPSINKRLAVLALLQATVSFSPDPVYTGETLTVTCTIQPGYTGWTYTWFRGETSTKVTSSGTRSIVGNILTISKVEDSDQDDYWCQGERRSRPKTSKRSDKKRFAVVAKPMPTLKADRKSVLTSNCVTLGCTVEDSTASWDIYWYKDNQESIPVGKGTKYLFSPSSVSEGGRFWCRGGRGRHYTHYSSSVDIIVSEAPVPVLSRHPDWPDIFTGETLILKCMLKEGGSVWTYTWLKKNPQHVWTITFSSEKPDYTLGPSENPSGEYQCRAQRKHDQQSSKVSNTITVSFQDQPKATLKAEQTVIPAGGNVTLTCSVEGSSGWKYYQYQNNQSLVIQDDQYSTGPIRVSVGGVYRCRAGRGYPVYYTEYSDALTLNTADDGEQSSLHVVGLIVGLVLVILLTLLLILLCRYRTKYPCCIRAVESQGTNQNSAADLRTNQRGRPDDGHAPLQHAESSDVTYPQIELKTIGKKKKEKPVDPDSSLYSEVKPGSSTGAGVPDVTYAQVNYQNKAKNKKGAGEPDVTYAQVNYQKGKAKNKKESAPPETTEDTVYSQVKPGTSRGW